MVFTEPSVLSKELVHRLLVDHGYFLSQNALNRGTGIYSDDRMSVC